MVVYNVYAIGSALMPVEPEAILIVHTDSVLPGAIPGQSFERIAQ
jgi:hypothetical protein